MRNLILVLGMHRSGTSVVARGLECLGVDHGPNVMGPAADNPKGFFEDPTVINIDENLLRMNGTEWSKSDIMSPMRWNEEIMMYARGYLAGRLSRGAPQAIKEPRMCRLLPFWREVIERVEDVQVGVVHVVRHPNAVAASLHHRNGLDFLEGYKLWERHVLAQFTMTDDRWPYVVVDYDNMLDEPRRELERVHCGLRNIVGTALAPRSATEFVMEFVDPSLRHNQTATKIEPVPQLRSLWKAASKLANSHVYP